MFSFFISTELPTCELRIVSWRLGSLGVVFFDFHEDVLRIVKCSVLRGEIFFVSARTEKYGLAFFSLCNEVRSGGGRCWEASANIRGATLEL